MSATPFVFSNSETITSLLDQSITRHYLSTVQQPADKIVAEYVWIGGTGQDLRSKGRWDWVGMASRCWARLIRLSARASISVICLHGCGDAHSRMRLHSRCARRTLPNKPCKPEVRACLAWQWQVHVSACAWRKLTLRRHRIMLPGLACVEL